MEIYIVIEKDPVRIVTATLDKGEAIEMQKTHMSYSEIQVWEDGSLKDTIKHYTKMKKKDYSDSVDYHVEKYGNVE